ncbi:hypothetical protein ACX8Z9_16800, partial [Arthrobacter halodurans]
MAIEPVDGTAHPVRAAVSGPGSSPEPAPVVGEAAGPACPPDSPAATPGAPGAAGLAACPAGAAPVAVGSSAVSGVSVVVVEGVDPGVAVLVGGRLRVADPGRLTLADTV